MLGASRSRDVVGAAHKPNLGRGKMSRVYSSVARQVSQSVSAQHPVLNRSSEDADFALRAAVTGSATAQP